MTKFEEIQCLDAPLADKLKAWTAELSGSKPGIIEIYSQFIDQLEAADVGSKAPTKGSQFPDFILQNSDGKSISSKDLFGKGPLVVSFNRGPWCSYCKLELAALSAIHSEISQIGCDLVSIMPESAESIRRFCAENNISYEILTDIDNGFALTCGLMISLSKPVQDVLLGLGANLPKSQGNDAWFVPIPATFIIAQDGTIIDRLVDVDFKRRMPPDRILETLRQIN